MDQPIYSCSGSSIRPYYKDGVSTGIAHQCQGSTDGVVERCSGQLVPHYHCFSLVRQPNALQKQVSLCILCKVSRTFDICNGILPVCHQLCDTFVDTGLDSVQQNNGVLLHPASSNEPPQQQGACLPLLWVNAIQGYLVGLHYGSIRSVNLDIASAASELMVLPKTVRWRYQHLWHRSVTEQPSS